MDLVRCRAVRRTDRTRSKVNKWLRPWANRPILCTLVQTAAGPCGGLPLRVPL